MNVLIYFDPAFRENTLKWATLRLKDGGLFICGLNFAQSVNSRLSIYQKDERSNETQGVYFLHREYQAHANGHLFLFS